MVAPRFLKILRENHDEVIQRWLDGCIKHIAEEFGDMLRTPMGRALASSMFSLAMEYLEAEDYERDNVRRRIRESASDSSFRRAAVGFSLPDIVTIATAFRSAMQDTLMNHSHSGEDHELLECVISLTRLGDAMVAGEIAGFMSFCKFGETDEGIAEAV